MKEKCNDRVIQRNDDVNWPRRSCNLTPLDNSSGFRENSVYTFFFYVLNEFSSLLRYPIQKISNKFVGVYLSIGISNYSSYSFLDWIICI